MKLKACLAGACLLAATSAQAQQYSSGTPLTYSQPEFYVGLNYAQLSLEPEDDFFDESADWNTVGINLGVQPSPYLAFEGRYGRGLGNDEHFDGAVETRLKHYFGFYALPQIPIQDFMSVYAVLGWTKAKAEASADALSLKLSDSDDDFSYGAGVRFLDKRNPNGVAFFIEYAQLLNRSDYDMNGLMLGLSWHF